MLQRCGAALICVFLINRVPQEFREAMKQISVKPADSSSIRTLELAAKTPPAGRKPAAQSSSCKWKSSFKPIDDADDDSQDKKTVSPERVELYNPYDPGSSDSEHEIPHGHDHSLSPRGQDNNLRPSGSCNKSRWDSSTYEPRSQPLNRHNLNPESNPTKSRGHRLPERLAYVTDTESLDPPRYGSRSRPLDHSVRSHDRLTHSASTQRFPASYGGQRTNSEERITVVEHRKGISPVTTTVRLSPPRLQRDYQHQSGYVETGVDQITPSTNVTRNGSTDMMDESSVTCDLCDVEVANAQGLEDHLDSKSHWDTLEHIQQQNKYDDLAIAFLQEVLLYKSHQCGRAIEDSALQALQENDHMTKIDMFHCAACKVLVSTCASSVQAHITSKEHLSNAQEFELQQRHTCLSKAETMMKELKPQFEHFLKGGRPFE